MRKIISAAAAAALILTLGACGGDDDDDVASVDTTSSASDDGGGDDTGGDTGGTDDITGLLDEDCQFLLAGAFLNPLAALSPGAASEVDFGESTEQLEAIAEAAPDEIKDAMAVIAERFGQMAEVFEDVDLDDPQAFADPEVQSALAELESVFDDQYESAGETISDYVDANCSG